MKKYLSLLFLILPFMFITNVKANDIYYDDRSVGTYEQELAKFPSDYQAKLRNLHNIYPNAIFVMQNNFFDYDVQKEIPVDFNKMVKYENNITSSNGKLQVKSQIEPSAAQRFRTDTCAEMGKSGCNWYAASKEGIEYYIDAYNFLDEKHIFMFESQLYNPNQTKDGVEKILAGTFMSNKNCPGSNKTYADVIIEAANDYGLGAYMLASRLKQEQGVNGTSTLISGKNGYYNYFNIGASGQVTDDVIRNGLEKAKQEDWNSPYKSIIGGAKFLRTKYIGANDKFKVKGQMTDFLQKWDVYGPKLGNQQYMTNIRAPYFEAETTYKGYTKISDYSNLKYIFYITVFQNAPHTSGANIINYKLGDPNQDGKIDSTDLLMVRKHLIGSRRLTGDALSAADVNKDGSVDSTDLLMIRKQLMGQNVIKE